MAATGTGSGRRVPLVVITQDVLSEEVVRLCAAAGCAPDQLPADRIDAVRQRWRSAPLVLLDAPAAARCAEAGLARRSRVVVVASTPDHDVWRSAVAVGADHVTVLPDGEEYLSDLLADAVEPAGERGRVLAVTGARGGAGASVLAAAVAVAAAADGRRTLLVDCDPWGGGLDLILGAEHLAGARWSALALGAGRVAAAELHAALPAPPIGRTARLSVLACDRAATDLDAAAVRAVCSAGRRAGDVVVCDVPRRPDPAATAAVRGADLAVLVVPAEVRACAGAAVVGSWLRRGGPPVGLVVRGPAPGGLTAADITSALDLPLLCAMRPQPGLTGALERGGVPGQRRGPLRAAAVRVLDTLDRASGTLRGAA